MNLVRTLGALFRRAPIISSLQELDPGPRRFLLFIVFNVVSWQCLIGPVLVLFARKIDMPPSWVGFLIAFTPISMVLVVVTGLMVMHWGAKRVMFVGWMLRNLISCTVFAMPLAIQHGGGKTAWYVLMGSTLGFCLMRALGGGGWYPWLHEVVPESQRGAYFSCDAGVTQLLNVLVSIAQALILHGDPGLYRFLAVYSIGIVSGFVSLGLMYRVPGGKGVEGPVSLRRDLASYRRALSDRPYVLFITTISFCFAAMSWFGASSVMFMRDALGIRSWVIMALTAAGSVGIMFTVRHWARFAEHSGSGLAMALALTGHALMSLLCLALRPGAWWTLYALAPIMVLSSVFGSAFGMMSPRAMLGYVKTEDRVGYTNLWTVGTAIALGVVPVIVGLVIEHGALLGFRVCFCIAGGSVLACATAIRRVVQDRGAQDRSSTFSPARSLLTLASVTLGLHESNR